MLERRSKRAAPKLKLTANKNHILLTLSANKLGLTDNCLQTTWSAHGIADRPLT
jgi:hypothetical protein